jgi:hypothetical protein
LTTAVLDQVLVTIDEMLTTKTIPALSGEDIETLCSHLFALRNRNQRIAVAEVAYLNHDDPQALNIFLACTMPLAQRMAENQAYRLSAYPTAWQLEAKYDGAVTSLLELFHSHRPLKPVPSAFRRFLMRTIKYGTMRDYYIRAENSNIHGVEDITLFSPVDPRNPVEQEVIIRELLEQVTRFPHLREEQSRLLKTIAALGPEKALRDQNYYWHGKHEARSKLNRGRRPLLDIETVAQAMGISKIKLQNLLRDSRVILRDAFNRSGNLFMGR